MKIIISRKQSEPRRTRVTEGELAVPDFGFFVKLAPVLQQ